MARGTRAAVRPFAWVCAVAAAAPLALPCVIRADTLPWALVQAYQNNPVLNAQRASLRAQDEAVPQALSGYRPRVSATASVGNQLQNTLTKSVTPRRPGLYRIERGLHAAFGRRDGDADAVQRLPDRATAPGRRNRRCLPRARRCGDRADRAARRRDRLHERAARQRDPRPAEPQRRGAAGAAAPDPRPLQCRRGDPHRRGAGRIACRRRPVADADRAGEPHHLARDLSPGDRASMPASSRRRAPVDRFSPRTLDLAIAAGPVENPDRRCRDVRRRRRAACRSRSTRARSIRS